MSKPEKKLKCGPITASIWSEGRTVQGEIVNFYSINIDKTCKDGDTWKHTTSFAVEDLPKVALLANEAYRYLRLSSPNESESN